MISKFSSLEKIIDANLSSSSMTFYRGESGIVAYNGSFALLIPQDYEGVLSNFFPSMYDQYYVALANLRLISRGLGSVNAKSILNDCGEMWETAFNRKAIERIKPTKHLYELSAHNILRQFVDHYDSEYWVGNNILSFYGKKQETLRSFTYELVDLNILYERKRVTCSLGLRMCSINGVPEAIIVLETPYQ